MAHRHAHGRPEESPFQPALHAPEEQAAGQSEAHRHEDADRRHGFFERHGPPRCLRGPQAVELEGKQGDGQKGQEGDNPLRNVRAALPGQLPANGRDVGEHRGKVLFPQVKDQGHGSPGAPRRCDKKCIAVGLQHQHQKGQEEKENARSQNPHHQMAGEHHSCHNHRVIESKVQQVEKISPGHGPRYSRRAHAGASRHHGRQYQVKEVGRGHDEKTARIGQGKERLPAHRDAVVEIHLPPAVEVGKAGRSHHHGRHD